MIVGGCGKSRFFAALRMTEGRSESSMRDLQPSSERMKAQRHALTLTLALSHQGRGDSLKPYFQGNDRGVMERALRHRGLLRA